MEKKIDWDHALDAVGGSSELLGELIEIFFEEYPKLVAGIQAAIESTTLEEIRRFSHTLKGCLRYFGKTKAGELAYELELMGRDGNIDRATEMFGDLQAETESLFPELKAFLASPPPDATV